MSRGSMLCWSWAHFIMSKLWIVSELCSSVTHSHSGADVAINAPHWIHSFQFYHWELILRRRGSIETMQRLPIDAFHPFYQCFRFARKRKAYDQRSKNIRKLETQGTSRSTLTRSSPRENGTHNFDNKSCEIFFLGSGKVKNATRIP